MSSVGDQPIVIKKVKKVIGGGHHGGAWKVAYADFVTAMMAFFLLMWLINTTSPEQKRGIADYFAPASVSTSTSGSGGILAGTSMGKDGVKGEGTIKVLDGDNNELAATGYIGHRQAGFVCRQFHFEYRLPRLLVEGAKSLSTALRAGREQARSIA